MRTTAAFFVALLVGGDVVATDLPRSPPASAGPAQEASQIKIRIQLEGRSLMATLDESEAARDFLSLLPLTLTLTDYHSTEKVADLPTKEQALAQLLGVIKAPIGKFVRTLAEPHAKLVRTIAAVKDQKQAAA